jgi:hypothetical protein
VSTQPIRVVATDLETGESGTQDLAPGKFVVICAEPAYVHYEQVHANGTSVVTIKQRQTNE